MQCPFLGLQPALRGSMNPCIPWGAVGHRKSMCFVAFLDQDVGGEWVEERE